MGLWKPQRPSQVIPSDPKVPSSANSLVCMSGALGTNGWLKAGQLGSLGIACDLSFQPTFSMGLWKPRRPSQAIPSDPKVPSSSNLFVCVSGTLGTNGWLKAGQLGSLGIACDLSFQPTFIGLSCLLESNVKKVHLVYRKSTKNFFLLARKMTYIITLKHGEGHADHTRIPGLAKGSVVR